MRTFAFIILGWAIAACTSDSGARSRAAGSDPPDAAAKEEPDEAKGELDATAVEPPPEGDAGTADTPDASPPGPDASGFKKIVTKGVFGGEARCAPCPGTKPFCRRRAITTDVPIPIFGKVATKKGQFETIKAYCQDVAPDANEADPEVETIQWVESARMCHPANTPVLRWVGTCEEDVPGQGVKTYTMARASVLCCVPMDDWAYMNSDILFFRVPKACGFAEYNHQTVDYTSSDANLRCDDWMGNNLPPTTDYWAE